ncbi:hypothetical protein K0M31_012835 [Melipona bicolor]|uniref:Uncharacterized protein n=1 Tax=Melipona bicolor TaxID=60889 RepID=A0AA40FJP4_9HYME|nr:hypothetical protein K0M31_012835 [Melipona bicolor]
MFLFVDNHIAKFFYDQVAETVETKQRISARRSDILQLFMDNNKKREPGKQMTVQDMTNQAFSFFFGRFDTVANLQSGAPVGRESRCSRKAAAGD